MINVRGRRFRWSAVIALGLLAFLVVSQVVIGAQRNEAQQTAQRLAEPLVTICERDPSQAAAAGANCARANEVAQDPGQAAAIVRDGRDGRGIASTAERDGRLVVSFTDGGTADLGPITGRDGRSIALTTITGGRLVVLYSDGERVDAGPVVGPAGRGIAAVDSSTGRLRLILTDGQVLDAGPLPAGPAGRDGVNGADGKDGRDGVDGSPGPPAPPVTGQTLYLDDGSTLSCSRAGGSDSNPEFRCSGAAPAAPTTTDGGG